MGQEVTRGVYVRNVRADDPLLEEASYVAGPPRSSGSSTSTELAALGLIGLYEAEERAVEPQPTRGG